MVVSFYLCISRNVCAQNDEYKDEERFRLCLLTRVRVLCVYRARVKNGAFGDVAGKETM